MIRSKVGGVWLAMTNDRGRWEEEWKLYEELRGIPLSEDEPEGAGEAVGLHGTVSVRKRSGMVENLWGAIEEWVTGIEMEGLRVLALWNCRWLKRGLVERGWKVDVALGSLTADAVLLRRARMQDAPVPEQLRERVGPEVVAPDDPRWDYFEKEGAYLVVIGV